MDSADLEGLWYSFRAGSVTVIAINNDDVCLQDAGDVYVHGYAGGAQKAWLEAELASARKDRSIDWIDVTYYRVKNFNSELEVFDTFTLTRPRSDGWS